MRHHAWLNEQNCVNTVQYAEQFIYGFEKIQEYKATH